MPRRSAGIMLYRRHDGKLEVLLVHPGGPLWAKRDHGAWSIPKGEVEEEEEEEEGEENALRCALRELAEELGPDAPAPKEPLVDLGAVRQRGGKEVRAWASEGECNPDRLQSNTFELEWPPRSGRHNRYPEVDRAAWFALAEARQRINPGQAALLERLAAHLSDQ